MRHRDKCLLARGESRVWLPTLTLDALAEMGQKVATSLPAYQADITSRLQAGLRRRSKHRQPIGSWAMTRVEVRVNHLW